MVTMYLMRNSELIAAEKEAAIKKRLNLINLPSSLKMSVFLDVYRDDVARLTVLNRIINFVNDYPDNRGGDSWRLWSWKELYMP